MRKDRAKISVIIPCYNAEDTITQAIESVINQTYSELELIIVDDGSTDGTAGKIHKFNDSRIKYIRHEHNKGIFFARNAGLQAANGDWIAPLDSDDAWHQERLEKLLRIFEKYPDGIIGSDMMLCFSGPKNELIPWKTLFEDRKLNPGDLYFPKPEEVVKYGLSVLPIFPKEAFKKLYSSFRPEFYGHEWMFLLLKAYSLGLKYIILNKPLYFYRLRPGSDSSIYECMRSQLITCAYLETVDWIDNDTHKLIRKNARVSKHRLLTTAIRGKKWNKVLWHFFLSPLSVFYLLRRIPDWTLTKLKSRQASLKSSRSDFSRPFR